jgi:cytoskeletal protein CcmA (bactofilin family)
MFGKTINTMITRKNEVETGVINTIGSGTSVTGNIQTTGDIRIDGRLEGTLHSKGKVVIGPTGSVKGDIHCQLADLYGSIEGNISCSELLALKASANLKGDIQAGKLSIEPGAAFSGVCTMGAVVKEIKHADKKAEKIA